MISEEYEDITLTCQCGEEFVFTAGEQKFYKEKGFSQPKRCVACRAKKKAQRASQDNQGD